MGNKNRIQSLIFDKKVFRDKNKVRKWINDNNYIVDKRLKQPIMKFDKTFRARQKNPDWFFKKTFKLRSLDNGVKGVFGIIKR